MTAATTARSAKRTRQGLLRLGALSLVALLATAFTAAPVLAAKGGGGDITGDIEVAGVTALRGGPTTMAYGDNVAFVTEVSGKLAPSGFVHLYVSCVQNGVIVYQSSSLDLDHEFVLADQRSDDNMHWDGDAADCSGWLVYRDGKKRNPTIEYLDRTDFAVAAG